MTFEPGLKPTFIARSNETMSVPYAVEVNRLSKTYRDGFFGRKNFDALKNVSLQVSQGEVFGLLGPNGAGKTTLLKILLGIISKTSGEATMLGFTAGSRNVRRQVGYLPEHLRIPHHLTAFTALELYGNLSDIPTSTIRKRRQELLDLVGLTGRESERVKRFSKGMLQRLGLAQALLVQPKLLILDEPTDGLDPRARAEMRSLIMKLKGEGVTVFVNSHILQEVELVCDRVAILDKGDLKYCGAVREAGETIRSGSPRISVDFILDLSQATQEVTELLPPNAINRKTALPDGSVEIETTLEDQAAVDGVIDRFRQHQISLVGLKRKRASLEEAFLAILNQNENGTAVES